MVCPFLRKSRPNHRGIDPLLQPITSPRTAGRGHETLRRGRWPSPGAEYFLILCTHDRRPGLTESLVGRAILAHAPHLTAEGLWHLRTATVTPDHVPLLVTLGDREEHSSAIRLFNGRLVSVLRNAGLHRSPRRKGSRPLSTAALRCTPPPSP
ncbi:MAG: hypothetical protein EXS32_17370 [Opitutus sp.]|nr:hypothetical protein [Opitutus sp.]